MAQLQLSNEAALNWSKGDWSGGIRALRYQTLEGPRGAEFREEEFPELQKVRTAGLES